MAVKKVTATGDERQCDSWRASWAFLRSGRFSRSSPDISSTESVRKDLPTLLGPFSEDQRSRHSAARKREIPIHNCRKPEQHKISQALHVKIRTNAGEGVSQRENTLPRKDV